MGIDIRAGKRVLYKHNGQWAVGELTGKINPTLNGDGLYLFVSNKDGALHDVEINDLFIDAHPVEDWMKQYHNLMTKEEYIEFLESDDFERAAECAWVSDGEYYYYPVSKYTATWLFKQPFDYVVR
jgi:hypothetical protein